MRICYQRISPEGKGAGLKYTDALKNLLKKMTRPDTDVTMRRVEKGSLALWVQYQYLEYLNNWEVIKSIIQSEREGYDAVVIGCFADPMLREAREAVDIPVCGAGESSYLLASMLGHRFAVIAIQRGTIPIFELNLRSYGLESRAVTLNPIRPLDIEEPILWEIFKRWSFDDIVPAFDKVAKACINDGAEVIIPGCTILSALLMTNNYTIVEGTSVPVLDCVTAALKMAEILVDMKERLGVFVSRANLYKSIKEVPEAVIREAKETHGLI